MKSQNLGIWSSNTAQEPDFSCLNNELWAAGQFLTDMVIFFSVIRNVHSLDKEDLVENL